MRLEDIHAEIRTLSLRLPPAIGEDFPRPRESQRASPPPAAYYPDAAAEAEAERVRLAPPPAPARAPRPDARPAPRAEPRFGPR